MSSPGAHPVQHIHVVPTQQGTAVFLVLATKAIVIQVDPAVGEALQAAIAGKSAERPLTHELMLALVQGLDAGVERVVINDVKDGVFFARVVLRQSGPIREQVAEVDARPSDALVLAVRAKAPVLVTPTVADACDDMTEALAKLRAKQG